MRSPCKDVTEGHGAPAVHWVGAARLRCDRAESAGPPTPVMRIHVSDGRRYRIEGVLGKGGFGTVYKAQMLGEGGFTRAVALKVLNADMAGMEDVARRLRDEARLLGLLRHRAILHVDGLVRIENRWTVVMEFIDGIDLQGVARGGGCPLGPALEIVGEVASALHVAYTTTSPEGVPLKLLHRDIKPPNILLTSAGEVKVLDFGIARAEFDKREAQTRSVLYGSVGYMAPERMDFEELHEGDVYALGTVFYEVLVGSPLGKASIRPERHQEHVVEGVDLIRRKLGPLPEGFTELLSSMLAYDPEERPSAREVERRCRALRQQVDGPWLRDWAERAIPPLIAHRTLGTDDDFAGSVVNESGGVSLLQEHVEGDVDPAPSAASPAARAPAPPSSPDRGSAPSRTRRGGGSWFRTLAATFGLFGCFALAGTSVVVGVIVLVLVLVALEPDPYADPAGGFASGDDTAVATLDTGAPPPPPRASPSAAAPIASSERAQGGGSGSRAATSPLASYGAPTSLTVRARLREPWAAQDLPVAPGNVIHSDHRSLVVAYGDGPVGPLLKIWSKSLVAQGWEVAYEVEQEDSASLLMERSSGPGRLAAAAVKNTGDIIVSISLTE